MSRAARRISPGALCLAVAAWAGCAAHRPMIEPSFAARTYTPARIAVLPPNVFMVLDQVGDNDPNQSAALGRYVADESVKLIEAGLRQRGYDVNLSARWDGIYGQDGQLLIGADEMGALANNIVAFANSEAGGGEGPMQQPFFIAPDAARRIGWATQSDALLYVNMKGVVVTGGKRANQIIGGIFIVVIIAAIIAIAILSSKNGGSKSSGGSGVASGGGGGGRTVMRATPGGGGGVAAPRGGSALAAAPVGGWSAPSGRGLAPAARPGRVYAGPHVHVGLIVPITGPTYTHDGQVEDEDEWWAGDQVYVSLTLVSSQDGRVLWHIRDDFDADASQQPDLQALVKHYLDTLPPSLSLGAALPPK